MGELRLRYGRYLSRCGYVILTLAASALNKVMVTRLLTRSNIERGVRIAIGSIVKYIVQVVDLSSFCRPPESISAVSPF
jgi:hypothetical protein